MNAATLATIFGCWFAAGVILGLVVGLVVATPDDDEYESAWVPLEDD